MENNMRLKYKQLPIFEVNKNDDLSSYDCRQKFLYKCDNCSKLKIVYRNFNKDLNNKINFLCNRCRADFRATSKGKILTVAERIIVNRSTNLNQYFVSQKVKFYCEQCGKEQHTSIMYLRQNSRQETKFLCQKCSTIKTVNKLYGVDYICQTFTNSKFISKQSIKFFDDLKTRLKLNHILYYNENEFGLKNSDGKYFKYDFTDNINKIIIEYNGDYWHPKCYNDPDWKNKLIDCNETYKNDLIKKECAEAHGFKIYYIWEHEVNEDYEKCLNICLNLWKE